MAITRTPIVDDDGTGTTGTVLNNAWKQEFYGQIDAADAAEVSARSAADTALDSRVTALEGASSGGVMRRIVDGRLTLASGVPVSKIDRTGATIYFTPNGFGDQIALYTGTVWQLVTFAELSITPTVTAGKNYDVFVYLNAGVPALELSAAWTNDTTRADALALQNGVYVKSGSPTRRFVGTVRAVAGGFEDSLRWRLVWNFYNRVRRQLRVVEGADTWAVPATTWRYVNNNAANALGVLFGLDDVDVDADAQLFGYAASIGNIHTGIGLDQTTGPTAGCTGIGGQMSTANNVYATRAQYRGAPGAGYHFLAFLEYGSIACTAMGDNGNNLLWQAGISGSLMG